MHLIGAGMFARFANRTKIPTTILIEKLLLE
jgi:hypothetical protein